MLRLATGVRQALPALLARAPGGGGATSALLGAARAMTSIRLKSARQQRRPRPPRFWPIPPHKWYLFNGDMVEVFNGYRHQEGSSLGQGRVIKVDREANSVVVDGINVRRVRKENPADGWEDKECAVHFSHCSLLDPRDGLWCRHKWGYLETGRRVRISRRSGLPIERPRRTPVVTPEVRAEMRWSKATTLAPHVTERTYIPPD